MAMDELEISKIVGAGCAALLAFVGFGQLGSALVGVDQLDEPAYVIEVAEADVGGEVEEEEVMPIGQLMAMAVVDDGAKVFKKCSACHKLDDGANGVGPHLYNVVGRDIGGVDGYSYSSVLMEKDGPWDFAALDGFLEAPKKWAPGTKMGFNGLSKPADRASVIAWLNEQGSAPLPMPAVETAEVEAEPAEVTEAEVEQGATEAEMAAVDGPADEIEMANAPEGGAVTGAVDRLEVEPKAGEIDPGEVAVEQEVVGDDRQDDGSDVAGNDAAAEEVAETEEVVEAPADAEAPVDAEVVEAEPEVETVEVPVEVVEAPVDAEAPADAEVVAVEEPEAEETVVAMAEPEAPAASAAAAPAAAAAAPAETVELEDAVATAAFMIGADAAAGAKVFRKCKACHRVEQDAGNGVGPNLYGVVGRVIASHDGFNYSDALKSKEDAAWDYENLAAFLTKPKDWAPGTKMAFPGLRKEADRANVIAYLNEQSDDPRPLPE